MLGVPCHLLEKRSPLLHIACSCKLHCEQLSMKKRSMVMLKIKACQVAFVCTVQVPPPSSSSECYLTIIPRARMGMEVEGRMGYRLRGHESEKNNCFSKIQLVGKKYRDKTALTSKTRFSLHCFGFQSRRFSLLVGYNIEFTVFFFCCCCCCRLSSFDCGAIHSDCLHSRQRSAQLCSR